MAKISNYGELKTWLSNTGHRGDLTAELPGFIQSAESMIAAQVRAVEMVTTLAIVEADRSANAVYDLPSTFLGAKALTGTKSGIDYALKQVSIAELYRYGLSGTPVGYSIYGGQIEFRASPATDAEFTLIYFKRPAAFVADADTNLLLQRHPILYQHASMYWFHIHTQDLELSATHRDAFGFYVEEVNAQAEEIRGTGVVNPHANFHSGATM